MLSVCIPGFLSCPTTALPLLGSAATASSPPAVKLIPGSNPQRHFLVFYPVPLILPGSLRDAKNM